MKRILIAITLLFAFTATPAFAEECLIQNVNGLSENAKLDMKIACLEALKESKTGLGGLDVTNPEALSAYGTVAQEWAKALGIAATELGIAADEFLGTSAGKLTAAVIIWQVAGESLLGLLIGIPVLIIIIIMGTGFARRCLVDEITYSETEKNWRGKPLVKEIKYHDADNCAGYWIGYFATIIFSIWTIAGIIL